MQDRNAVGGSLWQEMRRRWEASGHPAEPAVLRRPWRDPAAPVPGCRRCCLPAPLPVPAWEACGEPAEAAIPG